jgi:hypothetical protein
MPDAHSTPTQRRQMPGDLPADAAVRPGAGRSIQRSPRPNPTTALPEIPEIPEIPENSHAIVTDVRELEEAINSLLSSRA